MLFIIGIVLLIGGFAIGYLVGSLTSGPPTWQERQEENEWLPPAIPRADCMPPGCGDYPECNHRY